MAVVCILCLVSKYWLYLLQVFVAWCQYWLWLLRVFVAWCQSIGYACCRYLLPGVRVLATLVACVCCLMSEYWLCLLHVFVAWCQSTGYGCCMYLLPGVRVLAMAVAGICCRVSEYWLPGVRVLAILVAGICCLVSEYWLYLLQVSVAWCQSTGYTCCKYLLPGVRVLAIRVAGICCLASQYWLYALQVSVAWCQSTGHGCAAWCCERNVSLRLCTTCRCKSGNVEVPWSKQCQFRKTQIAVVVAHLINAATAAFHQHPFHFPSLVKAFGICLIILFVSIISLL